MANFKNCIKVHRYEICKTPKNHSLSNYLKILKYDPCAYWKIIYLYVTKKYSITCLVKNRKCMNCENVAPKCTSDYKYYSNWMDLLTNNNYLNCYIKRFLLVQSDFKIQNCEIKEFIQSSSQGQYYMVFYYPKFHY